MSISSDLRYRLRALFQRRAVETELDDELRFHFDKEVEKQTQAGVTEEEARRRARLSFGGRTQAAEDCREARGTQLIESLLQDIRFSVRQLLAHPAFAVVIVLTLALSIGANSAIFSVIDSVLIRSLPYLQANRLVYLHLSNAEYPKFPLNPFDFRDYRARNKSFESMAAMTRGDLQLSGGSARPVMLYGFRVTSGYFHVLGLHPEIGSEFGRRAEQPGNENQVILSDRLWRSRFSGAPDIIGRKITLNGEPFTIVGVMPRATEHPGNTYQPLPYGQDVDIWVPFAFSGDPAQRGSHYLEGIARLKPGVTIAEANSELNAIMAELAREHPQDAGWQVHAIPLDSEVVGSNRQMLLVLLGAVGMVLLIACANAANLLLSRAIARRRELAVRLALGAGRSRLVRQLLTESLLIAFVGGVAGLAMGWGGVKALVSLLPANFPRLHEIHMNGPVFAFTFLITAATGMLFGIVPAIQSSRTDPGQGLHEGGPTTTGGERAGRLRNALVIAEISLACVLLVGAGLMLRTFLNLLHLDPGFQQQHVLTATVFLPDVQYKTTAAIGHFYDQLTADLSALPGVQSAGAGTDLPFTGYNENLGGFIIEGKQPPPHQEFHGRYHVATPGYFIALGIPLLSGRFFTAADRAGASNAVIINRAMARRYWGDQNPVGRRISFYSDHPASDKDWTTIIGVVGDVKDKPSSPQAEPAFWWPSLQRPFPTMAIVVRGNAAPQALADGVRNEVRRLDPALAVANIREMDQIVQSSVATPRFSFVLVGLFAALAMLLSAIGIYGVIAYSVAQRTAEFGLRLALGAQRSDVLRMVLMQAAGLVVCGTMIGVVLALLLGRVLGNLIYDVSPADPLTLALAGSVVVGAAILACLVPARRATGVNPIIALRTE